ncbi:hypothetical protein KPH14_010863 [Odynerus spinipes]|uniref:Uncharacterized protein n=1 Tax=Odynerus spinipes TaxID=1348599 RepID=A0AAD9RGY2_9HYME|nr:hypothetical protein KPH14_010863 [Odynerus spinipes]
MHTFSTKETLETAFHMNDIYGHVRLGSMSTHRNIYDIMALVETSLLFIHAGKRFFNEGFWLKWSAHARNNRFSR